MKPTIIFDIETVPRPLAELEALMPDEMRHPVMPPEIANPEPPDFEAKCPDYGFKAASAKCESITDEAKLEIALRARGEIAAKRVAWMDAERQKFVRVADAAREKWRVDSMQARAKFIDNAALDPARGQVKLLGLSIYKSADTPPDRHVFAWEPDRAICDRLEKMAKEANEKNDMVSAFYFHGFLFERQAVAAALECVASYVTPALTKTKRPGKTPRARIIGFYINLFDLPFVARRAAICGNASWFNFLRRWKRGRYLDGVVFVDLCEEWKLGDNQMKTGGLNTLARLLGFPGEKTGDGSTFYSWYQTNPEEGVTYLLNDLEMTSFVARRLGFIA